MPKLLLIGGPLDGKAHDVSSEMMNYPAIVVPEPPDFSQKQVPVSVRTHQYKIFRIHVRNDAYDGHEASTHFAYHQDITAIEALVMLMQQYEESSTWEAGR